MAQKIRTQPITDWFNTFTPYGPLACALRCHVAALRSAIFRDNELGAPIGPWLNGPLLHAVNKRLAQGDHDIKVTAITVVSDRHHTIALTWEHVVIPPDGSPSYVEPGSAQITLYALSNKARQNEEDEAERVGPSRGDSRKRKMKGKRSY